MAPIIKLFRICWYIILMIVCSVGIFIHLHVATSSNTHHDTGTVNQAVLKTEAIDKCPNSQRLLQLQTGCSVHNTDPIRHPYVIYVDHKHKLMACLPPKSGCTTWKVILANNSKEEPIPEFNKKHIGVDVHYFHITLAERFGIVRLSSLSHQERQDVLSSYFKVIMVRHPLERLVSSYHDKMEVDRNYMRKLGSAILAKYHPELPPEQVASGYGVTFREFVKYILHTDHTDRHWVSIANLCHACDIKYDKVVKLDTQSSDAAELILDHLGPYHRGLKTHAYSGGRSEAQASNGKVLEEYADLSLEDIKGIVRKLRYDIDFQLFGYTWSLANNGTVVTRCGDQHSCC